VFRFEPDRQIAVSGLPVLDPKFLGALRDIVVERYRAGVVEIDGGSV